MNRRSFLKLGTAVGIAPASMAAVAAAISVVVIPSRRLCLSLYTANPNVAGDITNEASYTEYARQAVTRAADGMWVISKQDTRAAISGELIFPALSPNGDVALLAVDGRSSRG